MTRFEPMVSGRDFLIDITQLFPFSGLERILADAFQHSFEQMGVGDITLVCFWPMLMQFKGLASGNPCAL